MLVKSRWFDPGRECENHYNIVHWRKPCVVLVKEF